MLRPSSQNGYLYLGEEPTESWQIADPADKVTLDAHHDLFHQALSSASETVTVNRRQLNRILGLAQSYIHLTTYPLGTELVIKKLRIIRNAIKKIYG